MTGRVLLQVLKVVGITVPVTWFWLQWGRTAYGQIFAVLSIPIFSLLGMYDVMPEGSRDRFINYLPFLILMIVTPRLTLLRRSVGVVVGFVMIFFLQVFFVYMSYEVGVESGDVNDEDVYATMLPILLFCDAFPFVLWIIIAKDFVLDITSTLFENASH